MYMICFIVEEYSSRLQLLRNITSIKNIIIKFIIYLVLIYYLYII